MGQTTSPATPVLENRFLQTFCAVTASALLVFGTLILLTSTAPWTPRPEIAVEPSTTDSPSVSARGALLSGEDAAPERTASGQAEIIPSSPQLEEPDRTFTASTAKEPDEGRAVVVESDASAPEGDATLVAPSVPLDQDAAGADIENDDAKTAATNGAATANAEFAADEKAAPLAVAGDHTDAASGEAVDAPAAPLPPQVVASNKSDAATNRIAEALTTLPPRVIARDKSSAATDEIAGVLAALPPAPPVNPALPVPAASETSLAATAEATAVPDETKPASEAVSIAASEPPVASFVATGKADAVIATTKPASAVAAVATPLPPPPLPKRKPEAPVEPKVALVPASPVQSPPAEKAAPVLSPQRQKQAVQEEPKQEVAQGGGLSGIWKPMALAPADKPSTSLTKVPINRPSGAPYASKVWSQLARHKPRAGQRGSASVSFAIGENGTLGAVQIARSSGNSRLDQLALQTVRSAGPFPPPPSGAVSYTIRIDFQ